MCTIWQAFGNFLPPRKNALIIIIINPRSESHDYGPTEKIFGAFIAVLYIVMTILLCIIINDFSSLVFRFFFLIIIIVHPGPGENNRWNSIVKQFHISQARMYDI